MKRNIILLFVLGLMFLAPSCKKEPSDSVAQDKIWADYALIYDKNTAITYARVIFRFSNITGTPLELTSPATVKFENELLTFNPTFAYYEKQYAYYKPTGTFKYTDLDNNTFTNTVTIKHSIDFPSALDTLYKTAAYEMFWIGDSIETGEGITVTINGNHEGDAQIFYTNMVNAKSIMFPLNKLQLLGGNGNGTMWMERAYNTAVQQATSAGAIITAKYKAASKVVYIKD